MDLHYFGNPDLHYSEKLDPDENQSKKFGRFGGSRWSYGGPWTLTIEA
jgi:hypothetical protein